MVHTISTDQLAFLARYDTPTICNGLELVMPERQATGFTTEHLFPANPSLPAMVGYARTATIRAMDAAAASAAEMRERRMNYYDYVAAEPRPTVVVIQDIDPRPGFGAFWGEVQSNVHRALGCIGVVTDGAIRDIDAWASGFMALAGSIMPSHAHVDIVDFGQTVSVAGMMVSSDDLVHADRHGAVVIPRAAVGKLPEVAALLARREKVLLDACKSPNFGIEDLRQAFARSDEIH